MQYNPTDREFLKWIHERLATPNREGDHDLVSHQHRLRSIIARIPADAYTPTNRDDDEAVLTELDAGVTAWLESMVKTQPGRWCPVSNNPRVMRLWDELKQKAKPPTIEATSIHTSNLASALRTAISAQRELEKTWNYTSDSILVAGWVENLIALNEGAEVKVLPSSN